MAYASWVNPSKTSGNGNDTVNVSASSQNTGRNARQTTLTFKAANCDDVLRTVMQKGKTETTTMQDTASAGKTGGTVTITGVSNSSALTFSLGTGDLTLTLPSSYTANGVSVNNGSAIDGDPGATSEYDFSLALSVPENTEIESKSRQIIATDHAGNQITCTLTLAAGEAYLTVSPSSIELPWDASTTASFSVESNTNWTIA